MRHYFPHSPSDSAPRMDPYSSTGHLVDGAALLTLVTTWGPESAAEDGVDLPRLTGLTYDHRAGSPFPHQITCPRFWIWGGRARRPQRRPVPQTSGTHMREVLTQENQAVPRTIITSFSFNPTGG